MASWNDLCCWCCNSNNAAFWEGIANQLRRFNTFRDGNGAEDSLLNPAALQDGPGITPETFMMMGFMLLPILFVLTNARPRARATEEPVGKPSRDPGSGAGGAGGFDQPPPDLGPD